jgi:hypothetical protein
MQDGSKQSAEKQYVPKRVCSTGDTWLRRGYVVENWLVFQGLGRENRLNLFYRLNTKAIRTYTQDFLYFEVFVNADLFPHAAIPVYTAIRFEVHLYEPG